MHASDISKYFWNVLYTTVGQSSPAYFKLVQNAGARLLTRTKKKAHITLALAVFHCLPVDLD